MYVRAAITILRFFNLFRMTLCVFVPLVEKSKCKRKSLEPPSLSRVEVGTKTIMVSREVVLILRKVILDQKAKIDGTSTIYESLH